ncbi:uncharacterized protein LOC128265313 [Drosophila gunungcola]|uniref:uncharacterized protein LOC128265313 n=1 Tax=Drosophila gunungcola TaxID=103775 RepID=UPI0022E56378|nr:uncharacterized protein LOC128265313 [Drosophila gunungcola]
MHYAYITCMRTLCYSQHSKSRTPAYFCENCLQFITSTNSTHDTKECGKVAAEYPKPNTITKFKNFYKKLSPPVVIYADIEAVLKKVHTTQNDPSISSTTTSQEHIACAVSFFVVHKYNPSLNRQWTYEGDDCIKKFCQALKDTTKGLYHKYWTTQTRLQDECEPISVDNDNCCACELPIRDNAEMFYDQFSGSHIGYIHKNCKVDYKLTEAFFPVVFHNLSRYDIHLFIKELGNNLKPIPCNKELYIALTQTIRFDEKDYYKIQFIDSNRFLNSSLEKLASYMDESNFKLLKTKFQGEKFNQMRQKGVFPYDFLDSFEKMEEKNLPPIEYFYNSLTDQPCSFEAYQFAQKVWSTFNCKSIRDYLKLYLESDVMILADVFENFRIICLQIYKLDPVNYVTAPSISWDAMLKFTRTELTLISNPDMYNFIKRSIRGGLTQCTQRISCANNKYMKDFDSNKPVNFLAYIDANNLYGWAMSQPLPISEFKFLNNLEINQFDIKNISTEGDYGFMLEVDLEYPTEIHDAHNSLPFCPESKIPPDSKISKLIADLCNKENYIIHLKYLQLCIQHGLKIKKIHRILKFRQSCWLKPYIDLNTKHRKLAKNEFEKNFYKLMNNAIYGKTMENVEKRRDIALVSHYHSKQNSPGFRQRIASHNFHSVALFGPNLAAIEATKSRIRYDKPIYWFKCFRTF